MLSEVPENKKQKQTNQIEYSSTFYNNNNYYSVKTKSILFEFKIIFYYINYSVL